MRLLIIIFVVFLSIRDYSQNKILSIGIEGGPSVSQLYGFEKQKNLAYGRRITSTGGFFVLVNLSKHLSIKTGVSQERKGLIYTGSYQVGNYFPHFKTLVDLHYTVVPILLRASWGKRVQRFFTLGGYCAYLNQKSEITYGSNEEQPTRRYDQSNDFYKRYDAGLVSGIGLTYPATHHFLLSFELRDNLGLANISSLPIINNRHVHTNSATFLIGVSYNCFNNPRKKYDLKAPKSE